ncbi:MAG: hypothetical protein FJ143_02540, partial [Deltaproteobacteria bacterium]|nr:hypothetical protein [Deltaproteobacteria bacterium]
MGGDTGNCRENAGDAAMSTGRALDEFEAIHNPKEEIRFLRARVRELEREVEAGRHMTGESRVLAMALTEAIEAARPVKISYRQQKEPGLPITNVLHLTDLHYGEVIKGVEIEGFNEFSPEIAERRLKQLGEKVLAKTETMRAGYKVPNLHIIGTADYISGDIHRELSVTNAFPCPVQAVRCGYAIGALVMALAPHFERVKADFITLDNHGRMTVKPQAAQGGENNWSYVVGHIL